MRPTILKREVLPPRQPLREVCDFTVEAQASVTRAIWVCLGLLGLAHVILRALEMQL